MLIEQPARDYLLRLARVYAEANDLAMTTVARRFHGRVDFFSEFEAGGCSVTLSKYDEMVDAFKADWPEKRKWPVDNFAKSRKANKG